MLEIILTAVSVLIQSMIAFVFFGNLSKLKDLRMVTAEDNQISDISTRRSQIRQKLFASFCFAISTCLICLYLLWLSPEDTFFLALVQTVPLLGSIIIPSLQYLSMSLVGSVRRNRD